MYRISNVKHWQISVKYQFDHMF